MSIISNNIRINENTELPLWNTHGDLRMVNAPAGEYKVVGTNGFFKSRIVVNEIDVEFDHLANKKMLFSNF